MIRRGFTLLELVVVLVIVATVASMVWSQWSDDRPLRLIAASSLLQSDLEMAQVLNITHPEDPVVVRFNTDASRYWLAYASDPDTPLIRPDTGEPYDVTLGVGRASGAAGVGLSVTGLTGSTLAFDAQGGLDDFESRPQILFMLGGLGVQLDIAPSTGTVTESAVLAQDEFSDDFGMMAMSADDPDEAALMRTFSMLSAEMEAGSTEQSSLAADTGSGQGGAPPSPPSSPPSPPSSPPSPPESSPPQKSKSK